MHQIRFPLRFRPRSPLGITLPKWGCQTNSPNCRTVYQPPCVQLIPAAVPPEPVTQTLPWQRSCHWSEDVSQPTLMTSSESWRSQPPAGAFNLPHPTAACATHRRTRQSPIRSIIRLNANYTYFALLYNLYNHAVQQTVGLQQIKFTTYWHDTVMSGARETFSRGPF